MPCSGTVQRAARSGGVPARLRVAPTAFVLQRVEQFDERQRLVFQLQRNFGAGIAYNIDGAIFYDTGNVFRRMAAVSLSQFTHTAGFGLRYQTPFGPARLDFGFNLQPGIQPDGTPQPRMKVFFTLGNPF